MTLFCLVFHVCDVDRDTARFFFRRVIDLVVCLELSATHQPGIDLLFEVIDIDSILFGSEMVGAVRGVDPETGHYFDDTRRYLDALDLAESAREKVFSGNVRRVYPRLDAILKAQGR
jgi:hypothetical protein